MGVCLLLNSPIGYNKLVLVMGFWLVRLLHHVLNIVVCGTCSGSGSFVGPKRLGLGALARSVQGESNLLLRGDLLGSKCEYCLSRRGSLLLLPTNFMMKPRMTYVHDLLFPP